MYFHHILGIFGSLLGIFGDSYLLVIAAISCITELSTPFVNIRSMLYDLGIKQGPMYTINGALMTLTFFVCRCVF
jgi:hypothetical protein